MDSDFLTEADCLPNMNTATIAGKVIKAVETLKGKSVGISFVVGYQKHWPSGGIQEIPIRCYVSGQERIEKLDWLKMGEIVLCQGEITDKAALYCHRVEWLSKPERIPSEDDEYLAGMQRTRKP
jgi:hypothetical protein